MPKALDVKELFRAMAGAARETLGEDVPEARIYVESAARNLSANTKEVAEWLAKGVVDEEQAKALMAMHARSAKMALTAAETIGLAAAERAVNAALAAARKVVNGAVGFPLI